VQLAKELSEIFLGPSRSLEFILGFADLVCTSGCDAVLACPLSIFPPFAIQEVFFWKPCQAGVFQNLAQQETAASLNRTNEVGSRWFHE
jgi:hypothetical protein